jgi:hypothetical protein
MDQVTYGLVPDTLAAQQYYAVAQPMNEGKDL